MLRIFLCALLLAAPSLAKEPPPVPKSGRVKVEQARQWIDAGVQLVDVRTPEEWREGTIEGAKRIDWQGEDFGKRVQQQLDPKRPVLVYCRSGRRSAKAAKAIRELGFTQVFDLKGGILAWNKAGEPKALVQ